VSLALITVIIPVAADEDIEWLAELCRVARDEAAEIVIVLPATADPLALRPATGGGERIRVAQQPGRGKADALNYGLRSARNEFVLFIDCDVILKGDEISTTEEMLAGGAEFVGAAYGVRPPPFPILSQTSGWFFGARRNLFLELGGWDDDYLEDVKTIRKIMAAGHRIRTAPFVVELRRAPRRPLTKLLGAAFTRPR
jgi:cellulose synthase/poly-beta-1,6-N-acetylglucosamine synthase-like glycosyltransferase